MSEQTTGNVNLTDLRLFGKPPIDQRLSLNKLCESVFWKFREIEVIIYNSEDKQPRFGVDVNLDSMALVYENYNTAENAVVAAERKIEDLKRSVDLAMR